MLTEISIENFKAFGKKQIIPLKPITLLYGPNSSGKTSLIQALLLFKQTLESMNRDIILQPRGNYVDLGGYAEFINDHDTKKNFSFGVGFDPYNGYFDEKTEVWHKRSLEYSFSKAGQEVITVKSLNISESLFSSPVASYENIWFFPELKKAIERKGKTKSIHGNEKFSDKKQWFTQLKRSLLVRKALNLRNEAYQRSFPSFRYYIENHDDDEEAYENKINDLREEINKLKQTIRSLKSPKQAPLYPEWEALKARVLASDILKPSPSVTQSLQNTNRGKRRLAQRKRQATLLQKERALAVMQKIYRAMKNKSCDQFSTIDDIAFDSLVSLSNCFPDSLMSGSEDIFNDIDDFILLGSLYEINSAHYISPILPVTSILEAAELFRLHLNDLKYIGPLRRVWTERFYQFSGNIPSDVGISGQYTPDILIGRPDIVEAINQWFTRFGLNYSIDIKDVNYRDNYEITLIDRMTGSSASVKDVGFGISQIVPVIVQGLMASTNILCIEQPEIHLHPRLQAELGDFFISIAQTDGNSFHYWAMLNQLIIETHSEHLILRLLRRIRETTNGELENQALALRPQDVAVIYAKPTEHGTELTELRISEDGDFIDKWPDGFFTEREKELF